MASWLVIGAGRCGLQLARAMAAAGLDLAAIVAHSERSRRRVRRLLPGTPVAASGRPLPPSSHCLVAVPDAELAAVAAELAGSLAPGTRVALHTSGLHPGAILTPLRGRARALGSFHPLLSFPTAGGAAVATAGAVAGIEGDPPALGAARALARALGMTPVQLTAAGKPRYHAAAVMAANLTHALVVEAREELLAIGLARPVVGAALAALVSSALGAALAAHGWEKLTGPLPRGDVASVEAHLAALPAATAAAYRAVAALAVGRLRDAAALDETTAARLFVALTEPYRYASVGLDDGS